MRACVPTLHGQRGTDQFPRVSKTLDSIWRRTAARGDFSITPRSCCSPATIPRRCELAPVRVFAEHTYCGGGRVGASRHCCHCKRLSPRTAARFSPTRACAAGVQGGTDSLDDSRAGATVAAAAPALASSRSAKISVRFAPSPLFTRAERATNVEPDPCAPQQMEHADAGTGTGTGTGRLNRLWLGEWL